MYRIYKVDWSKVWNANKEPKSNQMILGKLQNRFLKSSKEFNLSRVEVN